LKRKRLILGIHETPTHYANSERFQCLFLIPLFIFLISWLSRFRHSVTLHNLQVS
jgi:hypothetical protein